MIAASTVRDRLAWQALDPTRLRQATYLVISRTQDDPAMQVAGMAIALTAVCRALDIDMRALIEQSEKMADDFDGPFQSTFSALEAYARNEIGRL